MISALTILKSTGDATGQAIIDRTPGASFQATIVGTGSYSTTVTVQCSLDAVNWITLGTINLSSAGPLTDGFTSTAPWVAYRAVASGSTGTITSIVVNISEED